MASRQRARSRASSSTTNAPRPLNLPEVVVVASTIPPIIDLCTPRSNNRRRPRNDDVVIIDLSETPPRRRRRHNEVVHIEEINLVTERATENDHARLAHPPVVYEPVPEINTPAASRIAVICSICLQHVREPHSTSCGHVFCKHCIFEAMKFSKLCPQCRARLTKNKIHPLYFQEDTEVV